ncbi:DUF4383 domain-containing protein [Rhodococcus maanshanensis]|uniref:DUF4383 domain-containing protein n=1 Tax=Rhodococcus maanshanensis TaxID=183556 RepID=A0A1H7LPS1_9NOCA|nr:DUF4383 domain-containing protein [Rhodococcus maanshanensis]SEL00886.1 protein of unknown function [Rhodococcus maanshanensis]
MKRLLGASNTEPVQMAAGLIGLVFVIVGALGFVPGLTTGYDTLAVAHDSHALLFGMFEVSILHNVVHMVFGAAGVAASRSVAASALFLVLGGIGYLVLWIYGLIADDGTGADVLPTNPADDWLHLGLGVAMLVVFFATPRLGATAATDPHRPHAPIE